MQFGCKDLELVWDLVSLNRIDAALACERAESSLRAGIVQRTAALRPTRFPIRG